MDTIFPQFTSDADIRQAIHDAGDTPLVLFFWADFHEASKPEGQLWRLMASMASRNMGAVQCAGVDAMAAKQTAAEFHVASVPTVVALKSGVIVQTLPDATGPGILALLEAAKSAVVSADQARATRDQRLRKLATAAPIVLFMKGNAENPRCKFSRQTVALLQELNVPFASFDILQDRTVREGLKEYSNWPTFPQLYASGTFIGGLDTMKEMHEEEELLPALADSIAAMRAAAAATTPAEAAAASAAESASAEPEPASAERCQALVDSAKVMLFMKGTPDAPRCGFSRQIVAILQEAGVQFASFDVLSDQSVRAGMKTFGSWPTFPQLYVDSELVGGLDIVKGMCLYARAARGRPCHQLQHTALLAFDVTAQRCWRMIPRRWLST